MSENNKISNLEIERKFLVKQPDLECLNVTRQLNILQIYLKDGEDCSQRRVRRITENGTSVYVYTEKIFYTAVTRKETEYEINKEKYEFLLTEKRKDCAPINKRRVCFEFRDQNFELDIYPFSDTLAILELELESPDQEIFFPESIDVIKEVTGVKEYSNSALGTSGAFPDDALEEGDS